MKIQNVDSKLEKKSNPNDDDELGGRRKVKSHRDNR